MTYDLPAQYRIRRDTRGGTRTISFGALEGVWMNRRALLTALTETARGTPFSVQATTKRMGRFGSARPKISRSGRGIGTILN